MLMWKQKKRQKLMWIEVMRKDMIVGEVNGDMVLESAERCKRIHVANSNS
jgi:hypothetical protein